LKKALTFNTRTQPIKLPYDSSYSVPGGADVLLPGRGATENPLHSTELLKGIVVQIVSYAECSKTNTLTDAMICINNGEGDVHKNICFVCMKNDFYLKLIFLFNFRVIQVKSSEKVLF
jgi:hypothetical protein